MGVMVFRRVNVCRMMYKAFAHLHTCTSRTVNVQHAAVGAFAECSASAALGAGVTDAAASLSVGANKALHHFSKQQHGDDPAEPERARVRRG